MHAFQLGKHIENQTKLFLHCLLFMKYAKLLQVNLLSEKAIL